MIHHVLPPLSTMPHRTLTTCNEWVDRSQCSEILTDCPLCAERLAKYRARGTDLYQWLRKVERMQPNGDTPHAHTPD